MATAQRTIDFLLDQLSHLGGVTAKKMFGEFALYYRGKIVALVCDDRLFVKKTVAGGTYGGALEESSPYPGAKPCFVIDDKIDDREWLGELIVITERELPVPQKKQRKT